jgi:hypothetical protein
VSKASRKYYRTILLGIAAMAALVWSAVDQFGIAWEEILQLFLTTLAVLLLVIVAAALTVGVWQLFKRLGGDKD